MPYYSLYIPASASGSSGGSGSGTSSVAGTSAANEQNSDSRYVFRVKCEALEELKFHKEARLREFNSEDDAVKYAQTGYEVVQTKYADVKTSTAALEKAAFRAPTKQELIEFRKVIEAGDIERVKHIIWDNPRYLVSSGDTPTTLKEGYRYNAMHVCAISKKPQIAELILQTVSDPKFVDLLTGKKNDQKMCKELCANLLDYYLNIPEKGRSETPLHFAAKNGCVEVVEVLTSYPECKMTRNSEGLLAKDIICSRCTEAKPELFGKIKALLEERFYVPVLRSMDSAIPPQVGQPFPANNPPNLNCDPLSPEVKIQALAGPMNKEQARQFCRRWKTPPRMGSNTSSPIINNPFISPVKSRNTPTPNTPIVQRTLFKTTPQPSPADKSQCQEENDIDANDVTSDASLVDKQNGNHKPPSNEQSTEQQETDVVISSSYEIQIETNNNNEHVQLLQRYTVKSGEDKSQANMLKSTLCPKTPLLKQKKGLFCTYREPNVPSPIVFDGLLVTKNSTSICGTSERDIYDTPGYKERHIKISDTEKGLEVIGRELAKEQNIGWREYWDFLNAFIDIVSDEGMQQLETYLARAKESESPKQNTQLGSANANANPTTVVLDDVCTALEKLGFSKEPNSPGGHNGLTVERYAYPGTPAPPSQFTTPYACVEKSLQVFAKRMTKTIIHNIENVVSINDTLLSELKRLKSLICSFKEDARFLNVNFTKVHSRIGNLISIYLNNSQEVTPAVKIKIQNIIQNLLFTPGERRDHMECVCSRIMFMLEYQIDQILPEHLKTESMCAKMWKEEKLCDCQWDTNLSRKTSRRNRMEARYKTHQQTKEKERVQKRRNSAANSKVAGNFEDCRNPASGNNSSDELEDEVFWSDFGGSDTEEDNDDIWLTPPESPSLLELLEDGVNTTHSVYVYGNEPTKRDLDVLNALFHVDLDKTKYPNIHAWKTALLSYPHEEMDYFPSPSVIRKSHTVKVQHSTAKELQHTPTSQQKRQQAISVATIATSAATKSTLTTTPTHTPPFLNTSTRRKYQLQTKRLLFNSPRSQSASAPALVSPTIKITSEANTPHNIPTTHPSFLTRLFTAYRERTESSPMSTSSASSPAFMSDRSGSDGSNNLSLLNVSATE